MSARPMCAWDSTSPGMRVPPRPSMMVAPSAGGAVVPGVTSVMRLRSTRTEPANGSLPLPSKIRTLEIRYPAISASCRSSRQREARVGGRDRHLGELQLASDDVGAQVDGHRLVE